MGGVFRAVGSVAGGAVNSVKSVAGGVVGGATQFLTGHPIKAVGSLVGGVAKGGGHILKGGLGAVRSVAGDPLVMGAAGLATGGLVGALAAPMIGQLGAGIAGTAETGVSQALGLEEEQSMGEMAYDANLQQFGATNAYMADGVGQPAPAGTGFPASGAPTLPTNTGMPGSLPGMSGPGGMPAF